MSIITDYFNYLEEYTKIYGENTVVLLQVGSFFEVYSVNNNKEKIGNAEEITQLLNIQLTRKNKKIPEINRKNPYMAGIPVPSLDKYLPVLLDNNYTVVLVEQITSPPNPQRKVTNVYSPGTVISKETYSSYITTIFIEKIKANYLVGLACIDISNAKTVVHELYSTDRQELLNNIFTFIKCFAPKECIIYAISHCIEEDILINFLELNNVHTHYYTEYYKDYSKASFQNEYLAKIYTNNTLLSTLEFLNLENKISSTISFMLLLDFIYKHNETMLTNLDIPDIYDECNYLIYTMDQLDLFEDTRNKTKGKYKCVFDVINKTLTSIGKRYLKDTLLFPIINKEVLQEKYNLIENIQKLPEKTIIYIQKCLSEISDIERLHRKMSIGTLSPLDFQTLDISYKAVLKIADVLKLISFPKAQELGEFMKKYNNVFTFNESLRESLFQENIFPELDNLCKTKTELYSVLKELAEKYSLLINSDPGLIKIGSTDKEGYYLTTTNTRANLLKKELKSNQIMYLSNKSGVKITSKEIQKISESLIQVQAEITTKTNEIYIKTIKEMYKEYSDTMSCSVKYIGYVDTSISNYTVSIMYSYSKPEITESSVDRGFLDIEGLRHPLVERINETTRYTPNNVSINQEGIILYGLNFAGKSTLIKSIGLAVILAQAGMYVPCEKMVFSPFQNVITRLQGNDNILKGQSSFVVEMLELRNILKNANSNTLIIMDELCRGTESVSANAIVATSVLELAKKRCNFILATHLRFLAEYQPILQTDNIKIMSLSVKFENDTIIFDRKLKDEMCTELYGIEVCKFLGMESGFIEKTLEIRDKITGKKKSVLSTKKSKYNSKKIVDCCEICKYFPTNSSQLPLDVHHINFQCNADSKGIIETFHKNDLHNLVVLCKKCHQAVHSGEITIEGFKDTATGPLLLFS